MESKSLNNLVDNTLTLGLSSKELLLSFLDAGSFVLSRTRGGRLYESLFEDYRRWRKTDRTRFRVNLKRLKQQGFIREYSRGKQRVLALTPEGRNRAERVLIDQLYIERPAVWNRKWHLIIFDIPEKHRLARTVFRRRLQNLGFIKIQKSVFIHPFDATDLVSGIRKGFGLDREIQYIVADQIEQEGEILSYFLDKQILTKEMLTATTN